MTLSRRRRLEVGWLVVNVVYAALRTFVAWATVRKYGVNIYGFVAVEVGSSIPYAIATSKAIGALVDKRKRHAVRWGLLAAVVFPLPELYVGLSGHGMPKYVYAVLVGLVVALGVFGALTISRRVRAAARPSR